MKTTSPFIYSTPSDFLKAVRDSYGGRKRPVPLKLWAHRLGYKTSRSLELVISGQRLPSQEMVEKLTSDLKLSPRDKKYFDLMLKRERYLRKKKSVIEIEKQMDLLRPDSQQVQYIENEVFKRVSEWYPLVIRQLAMTPKFKKDIAWIQKKLRGKVTLSQAASSLAEWDGLALDRRSLLTSEDLPNQAGRTFHKKMLMKAIESLDEIDVHQREFISITFKTTPEKIQYIKKVLRDLRDQVFSEFDQEDANEVFQLCLAFFPHTQFEGTIK